MWSICRVDNYPDGTFWRYFEIQAAYRKADLDVEAALRSGFIGPEDSLVIVSPSGRITAV